MNAPHPHWPAITTPAEHFIGGRFMRSSTGLTIPVIDPSDGAPFAAIARGNAADIDAAVTAAHDVGHLPHHGGPARRRRPARLPAGGPALVHDGRLRLRHGLRRDRPAPHRRWRARGLADQRGAPRGVDPRLEGVRARGDARPRRQRRHRLLDRERRPDGRPHRRLDHGRARDDAHRPRVPAPARPLDRHHPRGRRRHGWLQHPVRGEPRRRPGGRHRDEPAGLALQRARLQGDRLPDRQDRGEGRHRLHPRRDPQRHHPGDAGELRARPRLRRGEGAAVRLREVPRRRPHADHPHEVGGRGDGDRAQLHRGAAEGVAQPGVDGRAVRLEPPPRRPRQGAAAGRGGHPARRPAAGRHGRDPGRGDARRGARRRPGSIRGSSTSCACSTRSPRR